jgi:hypothetical protein
LHEAAHARGDPLPPRTRCGDRYMARDRSACHLNAFNDNTACLLGAPGSFDRRWRNDDGESESERGDPEFDRWGRAPVALVEALLDARYRTLVFWGDSTMWHRAFALQVEPIFRSILNPIEMRAAFASRAHSHTVPHRATARRGSPPSR